MTAYDISGLRCIDYDEKLRVDNVKAIIEQLSVALKDTMESKEEEVCSLIQLLAVDAAKLPDKVKLSDDTGIILSEIKRLRDEILHPKVEYIKPVPTFSSFKISPAKVKLPNGEVAELNSRLYLKDDDKPFYDEYGILIDKTENYTLIKRGKDFVNLSDRDAVWDRLTIKEY